jgi:hypothetical protein
MTLPNDYDDAGNDGGSTQNQGGSGLRKQLEDALAQLKTANSELTTFRAQQRVGSVAEILKAKGVHEAAAQDFTGEDVSEGAVDKWLAARPYLTAGVVQQEQEPANDPNADAARRVSEAAHGHPQTEALSEAAKVLGDPEELMRLIQTGCDDDLVKLGILKPADNRHIKGGYIAPSPMQR